MDGIHIRQEGNPKHAGGRPHRQPGGWLAIYSKLSTMADQGIATAGMRMAREPILNCVCDTLIWTAQHD
eukprot:1161247-Pelagomonas_calceolata.AAC.7